MKPAILNTVRMETVLKRLVAVLCIMPVIGLAACAPGLRFRYESDPSLRSLTERAPVCPEASFIVLSDLHTYAPSLGIESRALQEYLAEDRKLLRESTEILEKAIEAIKEEKADFVLVAGDLTKDGERTSHELLATYLSQIEDNGKQVYVVPGNHDILNGHSFKYTGDMAERTPNVASDEFAEIYAAYGYGEAIYRDAASLSYVAEPEPGLCLMALDGCGYRDNRENEHSVTDGRFNPETVKWVEEMLIEAGRQNRAVIAMLHHGVLEHYRGQDKYYDEYLLDDYPAVSKLFAMYNVRLVFTGHYHAQDITVKRWEKGKFLFDIETGSLVTYPSPYRTVSITPSQQVKIATKRITGIRSHPNDFQEFALSYIEGGIVGIATRVIQGYGVNSAEAESIARQVARAFIRHYAGDESLPASEDAVSMRGLSLYGRIVVLFRKGLIEGLSKDMEPPDNNIVIDLGTGKWQ